MHLSTLIPALRSGEVDLMAYLDELEARFIEWEPVIYSFVPEPGRWSRVRQEAEELLARYPSSAQRPPLFGVPVGIKDIFHVDGLPTRGGSRLPAAALAGPQAASVSALKAAGALILGKTATTEFAYFGPSPARNPHNPFHTPGGSSSGSAAAVGAGLVPLALGTQTIGSVNRPAAFCGIVGFKPTYNRISKDGVLENATSHDHVGFFTTDVAGAAVVAAVLCANWRDLPTINEITLGIPTGPYLEQTDSEMRQHFDSVCQRLQEQGIAVKEVAAMPDFDDIVRQHLLVNAIDAARYHDQFSAYHHLYHPKTIELIHEGQRYTDKDLEKGREVKTDLRRHLVNLMDVHGLDGWITPGAPGPAPEGYASTGNPVMQLPFTNAGVPSLTIPTGQINGLPVAIQLAGRANEDEKLFAVGKEVENKVLSPKS
ncbi:MAG: amidase [Ardenticatenaceae bacterium]|nr:amidase [Ardenticatenaceae bacterium]